MLYYTYSPEEGLKLLGVLLLQSNHELHAAVAVSLIELAPSHRGLGAINKRGASRHEGQQRENAE